MSAERIYIYKRYERFWHWSQALLIITMMISGFEVHGSYVLLGFKKAVQLHTLAAWSLLTLCAWVPSQVRYPPRHTDRESSSADDCESVAA